MAVNTDALAEIMKSLNLEGQIISQPNPSYSKINARHGYELFVPKLVPTDLEVSGLNEFKVSDIIQQRYREVEEQLLREVLKQILNREPTLEDAKLLTRRFPLQEGHYYVDFNGKIYGKVFIENDFNGLSHQITFKFEPINPK